MEGWRTAYRGIMPDPFLASLEVEPHRRAWHELILAPPPDAALFVATHDSRVVGFALGGRERTGDPEFVGELQAIYVLERYHRRGIGRRLVESTALHLVTRRLPSFLVWVLRDNPWHRFYERLGGRPLREREIEIAGDRYPERAYGWPDARALLGGTTRPAHGDAPPPA